VDGRPFAAGSSWRLLLTLPTSSVQSRPKPDSAVPGEH